MIYFIQAAEGGPIKIGYAVDPNKRLVELQRMSPAPLRILVTIEGTRKKEGKIHRHFVHLRQHGEWFRAEQELLDFIANPLQELPKRKRLTLRQAKALESPAPRKTGAKIDTRLFSELWENKGITLTEASQITGLAPETIRNIREGRTSRFDAPVISQLCGLLDIPPGPVPFLVYEPD